MRGSRKLPTPAIGLPRVIVWGAGCMGLSTAMALANVGVRCRAVDINAALVKQLKLGRIPFAGFEAWIDVDLEPLLQSGVLAVSSSATNGELAEANVHIVCVNTESRDRPDATQFLAVLERLNSLRPDAVSRLIAIESTVALTWIDEARLRFPNLRPPQWHLVMAPRRDWFGDDVRTLRNLPRIIGADTPEGRDRATKLYSPVCDQILFASTVKTAALVKVVENSLRFVNIVLTNQIAAAYDSINVTEVMDLAATKWNIPHYHPSLGIGGHCIPLAPRYLLAGAARAEGRPVTLVEEALLWEESHLASVASRIASLGISKVGVLGLSYTAGTRIIQRSTGLRLVRALDEIGIKASIHDPLFDAEEVEALGATYLHLPSDLDRLDLIVVATAHTEYQTLPEWLTQLPHPPTVVDNLGQLRTAFAEFPFLSYVEVGSNEWLTGDKLEPRRRRATLESSRCDEYLRFAAPGRQSQ